MIGKLKGIVDSYGEDYVILDVNGVGYLVFASARTLGKVPGRVVAYWNEPVSVETAANRQSAIGRVTGQRAAFKSR